MNVEAQSRSGTRLYLGSEPFEARVAPLVEAGVLLPGEVALVDLVAERWQQGNPDVLLALALAVRAPRQGHVGVDLTEVKRRVVAEMQGRIASEMSDEGGEEEEDPLERFDWPDGAAWGAQVAESPLVGDYDEGRPVPFVLQRMGAGRSLLMTHRMAAEQRRVGDTMRELASTEPEFQVEPARVERLVAELFPDQPDGAPATAVRTVASRRLTVITGGPGTGKTFSVKRTLAALLRAWDRKKSRLRIELAAPTGKAAVRMQEAMVEGLEKLPFAVREPLRALRASTLHGLLGVRPDGSVRHHRQFPIPADVVVVDEASMVDLVLMRMLLEAVAPGARLILLGDPDQLASVEAGTVLADMVSSSEQDGAVLHGAHVRLQKNYRFEKSRSIGLIAEGIQGKGGGLDQAMRELLEPQTEAIRYVRVWREERHGHFEQRVEVESLKRFARAFRLGEEESGNESGRGPHHEGTEPGPRRGLASEFAARLLKELDRPSPSKDPWELVLDAILLPYLTGKGYLSRLIAVHREAVRGAGRGWTEDTRKAVLEGLHSYRVLAVHRRGRRGVWGLNGGLAERVRELIRQQTGEKFLPEQAGFWLGQIVLVTRNAHDLDLQNGDVGLVLPARKGRGLAAFFLKGAGESAELQAIPLARLPEPETGFAMTVHKSQGSQFDRVAVVLAAKPSAIQSRELVYTAITRAKSKVDWYGDEPVMRQALETPIQRASGLHWLLRGGR